MTRQWLMTHEEECAGPFWILSSSEETHKGEKSLLLPVGIAASLCHAWNDGGPPVTMGPGCR